MDIARTAATDISPSSDDIRVYKANTFTADLQDEDKSKNAVKGSQNPNSMTI